MPDESLKNMFNEGSSLLVEWESKRKLNKCWDERMELFNDSWTEMRQPLFEMSLRQSLLLTKLNCFVRNVVKKQLLDVKNVASTSIYVGNAMLKYT